MISFLLFLLQEAFFRTTSNLTLLRKSSFFSRKAISAEHVGNRILLLEFQVLCKNTFVRTCGMSVRVKEHNLAHHLPLSKKPRKICFVLTTPSSSLCSFTQKSYFCPSAARPPQEKLALQHVPTRPCCARRRLRCICPGHRPPEQTAPKAQQRHEL